MVRGGPALDVSGREKQMNDPRGVGHRVGGGKARLRFLA